MTMTRLTLPALMLCATALAACVEGESPMPTEDACGASMMGDLVGQNRSVLETMKFAGPVRIIEPGMAVTMDYIETRLNIELNEAGTITRVSCG
jgi:hypothetical protein